MRTKAWTFKPFAMVSLKPHSHYKTNRKRTKGEHYIVQEITADDDSEQRANNYKHVKMYTFAHPKAKMRVKTNALAIGTSTVSKLRDLVKGERRR